MDPLPPEPADGPKTEAEARDAREEREDQQDADFAAALGRAIKVFRTGLGMSRRDLADTATLSYSYVTEIENGKKQASAGAQKAIASALGLSVSELLAAAEEWVGPLRGEAGQPAVLPSMESPAVSPPGAAMRPAPPPRRAGPFKGLHGYESPFLAEPPDPERHVAAYLPPPAAPAEEGARKRQLRWFHTAARRVHALQSAAASEEAESPAPAGPAEHYGVESSLEQLRVLLSRMEAGDRERVVDLARRLAQG